MSISGENSEHSWKHQQDCLTVYKQRDFTGAKNMLLVELHDLVIVELPLLEYVFVARIICNNNSKTNWRAMLKFTLFSRPI